MVTGRSTAARALDLAVLALSCYVLAYGVLKASGLFAPAPVSLIRALHAAPPQAALYALLPASLLRMAAGRVTGPKGPGRLFWAGMLLMAAGLILSSMFRFEGKVVLTEGQAFSGAAEEYADGSRYQGRKASVPRLMLEAREVVRPGGAGGPFSGPAVLSALAAAPGRQPEPVSVGPFLPVYRDGVFLSVTRFGYSPLFQFTDGAGGVLKEFYWPLELYPPGSEDSLRSLWIPHVIYLRYFPEGGGGAASSPLALRIVRNLDLVFEGAISLNQPVAFDGMVLSIPEVRRWAEVAVVQDHGMLLFAGGSALAALAVVLRRRRRTAAGGGSHG